METAISCQCLLLHNSCRAPPVGTKGVKSRDTKKSLLVMNLFIYYALG